MFFNTPPFRRLGGMWGMFIQPGFFNGELPAPGFVTDTGGLDAQSLLLKREHPVTHSAQ